MKRRRQTTESEKKSEEETKTEFNPMYVMKIKFNHHIIGDDEEQFNLIKRLRYGQYYFDDGTQCPNEIEAVDENPDYNAV